MELFSSKNRSGIKSDRSKPHDPSFSTYHLGIFTLVIPNTPNKIARQSYVKQDVYSYLKTENGDSEPINHTIRMRQFHLRYIFIHTELGFITRIHTSRQTTLYEYSMVLHVFSITEMTDLKEQRTAGQSSRSRTIMNSMEYQPIRKYTAGN